MDCDVACVESCWSALREERGENGFTYKKDFTIGEHSQDLGVLYRYFLTIVVIKHEAPACTPFFGFSLPRRRRDMGSCGIYIFLVRDLSLAPC